MFLADIAQSPLAGRPARPVFAPFLAFRAAQALGALATLVLALSACGGPRQASSVASTTASSQLPPTAEATAPDSAQATTPADSSDEGEATNSDLEEAIERQGETPVWAPKKHQFNPARERRWDLLHTELSARLDFTRHELIGTVRHRLTPLFYSQDSLVLDAKGMRIERVARVLPTGLTPLRFSYPDSLRLVIALPTAFKAGEVLTLEIAYVAQPDRKPAGGGGEAISDDKGLYFIDPNPLTGKPRQVWTQGETEATSVWLPTLDAPNERGTQQIALTVPDSMVTLSNGVKVSAKKNADGTRTDTWRLDQPHAPYLAMIAAGKFAVVADRWRGKEVSYYVEPKYAPHARGIFGRTPEMLEFFSTLTGVPYPWPNYKQIIVRDFVSGAMENTSAVTFYERVQQDARGLLDVNSEDIISHELFHHWFGDYVTCESWANLPLNESFATYGEYLWFEHKYGRLEADRHLDADLDTYLAEATEKREPLIRYYYQKPDDMFDRHSYQKGGRVLHYLRTQLGDAAFFAGLKHYLTTHAYQAVEIHDLRQSFEAVTGRDLQSFFDQWFLSAGHPELVTDYEYLPDSGQLEISIQQTQDRNYQPLFTLPMQIEVALPAANGAVERKRIPFVLTSADTTLRVPLARAPLYVDVDADKVIPGQLREDKPFEHWLAQLKHAPGYKQQADALEALGDTTATEAREAIVAALRHPFWGLRLDALVALEENHLMPHANALLPELIALTRDPRAEVRAAALERLAGLAQQSKPTAPEDSARSAQPNLTFTDAEQAALIQSLTRSTTDSSYAASATAIAALYQLKPSAALNAVKSNLNAESAEMQVVIAELLMAERSAEAFDRVVLTLNRLDSDVNSYRLIQSFGQFLTSLEGAQQQQGIDWLKRRAEQHATWYIRLAAMQGLNNFRDQPDVLEFMREVARKETHPRLRAIYGGGR